MNYSNRLIALVGIAAATFAGPHLARAGNITFTDVVNTADEWSFNFSGKGLQLIAAAAPAPAGWSQFGGVGGAMEALSQGDGFSWQVDSFKHLPDGPTFTMSLSGPYGSTQSDSVTLPHGSGWDLLQMSLTVGIWMQDTNVPVANSPGSIYGQWGDFSGSFKAIHRGPPPSVPEGGATLALLVFAVGALGFVLRAHRKAS